MTGDHIIETCGGKDTLPEDGSADFADLTADRALLSTAVEQAGNLALDYFRSDTKSWQKGPGQIVTEADIAIDDLLHDVVMTARPDDGWVSEERQDDGSRQRSRRVWIIDPIDGTRSFAAGVGEFTISAALVIEGRPAVASVLNPVTSEHFEAVLGQGALLNGEPLTPGKKKEIAGSSLLASFGEMKKRRWPEVMPDAAFTTIGSLAYKLALVAAGRYDGLVSLRACHDWDIAAAVLLLSEAGAHLGDGDGRPIRLNQPTLRHQGLVAAGSKALYTSLVSRLEMIASASR